MSFTDKKPFVVTDKQVKSRWGSKFGCMLCGHMFKEGDTVRWIYTNHGKSAWRRGNFFVCAGCDGEDHEVIEKAVELVRKIDENEVLLDRF